MRKKRKTNRLYQIREGHSEQTLIIVANGCTAQTLTKFAAQIKKNKNIETMMVNKPLKELWPTSYWVMVDHKTIELYKKYVQSANKILTSVRVQVPRLKDVYRFKVGGTWSENPAERVHLGGTTTLVCLQLALWMNYKHIYIFGLDMTTVNGKIYADGRAPVVGRKARIRHWEIERLAWENAAKQISPEDRQKITIASAINPHAFVRSFNQSDPGASIKGLLTDA